MIDLFGGLSLIERSLDYHLKRHGVLSSNVANAETPGYRSKDVTFDVVLDEAQRLSFTHPGHVSPSGSAETGSEVFDDPGGTPGNDGNTVSMEREMAKVAANSLRYQTNIEIISRRLKLLKYAATDGAAR
jgi:flagellar basal-body rod protein FlgB